MIKIENFTKFHKPEKKLVITLLIALLIEVIAFGLVVPLQSAIVHNGALIQPQVDVAGEMSEPTAARLAFESLPLF